MPKLNHSILEELANDGYTSEAAKQKDALLSEGFTIVDEPTPFDEASPLQAQSPQGAATGAAEGRRGSSTSRSSRRPEEPPRAPQRAAQRPRYKRAFRAVYDYMEQAEAALEAASAHPEELDRAWEDVSRKGADLIEEWAEDEFILDMTTAITGELYRRFLQK